MPEGGALTIETSNIILPDRRGVPHDPRRDKMPPGDYIILTVADKGTGMPPDVMKRAFDPFFTTKPLGQGTGLGLSMAYGFVEQSGGQIYLGSNGSKGIIVTIYLPRYIVDQKVDEDDGGDTDRRPVILVVEDEVDVRMILVETLSDLACRVLQADNGKAGLIVLDASKRIDLLLTDVGLPGGMNGRQLADAARLRRPELKVLFITGYAESSAIGSGLLEQGMAVLTKPFLIRDLLDRVRRVVTIMD